MKNDRKLFPSWWYRIGERDYLSKGSRMKVYIAVPTSSFSSGSTRYFFCADKWNWVCNNRIVLWTGRDVWKMTLIVPPGRDRPFSPLSPTRYNLSIRFAFFQHQANRLYLKQKYRSNCWSLSTLIHFFHYVGGSEVQNMLNSAEIYVLWPEQQSSFFFGNSIWFNNGIVLWTRWDEENGPYCIRELVARLPPEPSRQLQSW